jgi:flavodoxin
MKILIVYDSHHGNTEQIAQSIREVTNKVHEVQLKRIKDTSPEDLRGVDYLVVGSPTKGGIATKNTIQFFDNIANDSLTMMKVVAYDTGIAAEGPKRFIRSAIQLLGYASSSMTKMLKQKGAKVIATKTFFILRKEGSLARGEIKRAGKWAEHMLL